MSVKIQTVAKEAGVSIGTVSRVFSGKDGPIPIGEATRLKVLAVAEQLKYTPNAHARSWRRQRSETIGLIMPALSRMNRTGHALTDETLGELLSGIEGLVSERGYRLTLCVANEQFLQNRLHLNLARDRSVDGLLLYGAHGSDAYVSELADEHLPVVLLRNSVPGTVLPSVVVDDRGGARRVTEYLLGLGHTCFGYLAGPENVVAAAERQAGFRAALEGRAVTVAEVVAPEGEFTEEDGERLGRELLQMQPRPTAIVTFNDRLAVGVYHAAWELGLRVPEDLSVAGGDGLDWCGHLNPALTTFRIPNYEVGRRAADRLLGLIEKAKVKAPALEVLPVEFVAGGSCAAPSPAQAKKTKSRVDRV